MLSRIDQISGRELEVAIAAVKALRGWDTWVTERRNDGELVVDVVATRPKNGSLTDYKRAELIQVTGAKTVSAQKINSFVRHHDRIADTKAVQTSFLATNLVGPNQTSPEWSNVRFYAQNDVHHLVEDTLENSQYTLEDIFEERPLSDGLVQEVPAKVVDAVFERNEHFPGGQVRYVSSEGVIEVDEAFEGCKFNLYDTRDGSLVKEGVIVGSGGYMRLATGVWGPKAEEVFLKIVYVPS